MRLTTTDTKGTREIQKKMDIKQKKSPGPYAPISLHTEKVAKSVLDAAFKVHSGLGPGLLESVYETCLAHELRLQKINVETQLVLPVAYAGITVDSGLRIDMKVDNCVIVEVKAVETMIPLYNAQLFTYLKLTEIRLGLLLNFNVIHFRDGIQRIVN